VIRSMSLGGEKDDRVSDLAGGGELPSCSAAFEERKKGGTGEIFQKASTKNLKTGSGPCPVGRKKEKEDPPLLALERKRNSFPKSRWVKKKKKSGVLNRRSVLKKGGLAGTQEKKKRPPPLRTKKLLALLPHKGGRGPATCEEARVPRKKGRHRGFPRKRGEKGEGTRPILTGIIPLPQRERQARNFWQNPACS